MKIKFCLIAIICSLFISCSNSSNDQKSNLKLKYLGAAGWEINDENSTVLVDPYLSRVKLVGNSTTKSISTSLHFIFSSGNNLPLLRSVSYTHLTLPTKA